MTNNEGNPKDKDGDGTTERLSLFVLRISFVIWNSSFGFPFAFVIRHSTFPTSFVIRDAFCADYRCAALY